MWLLLLYFVDPKIWLEMIMNYIYSIYSAIYVAHISYAIHYLSNLS